MNVFITGGLTGLGAETAINLMKDGHTVGICSFQAIEDIKDILPSGAEYYQADVTDRARVNIVVNEFATKHGTLDVIYANAGINHPKQEVPDWDIAHKVVDINIKGVMNTVEPAIEIMKKQKSGHIVTISSISGFAGLPGMSVYGSTKAFIRSFSETLSVDLGKYGIEVTCLAPGFIATPLTESNKHNMPFLLTQEQAGKEIIKAIYQQKSMHIFPFPQKFIAGFLYHLPRPLYRFIMKRDLTGLKATKH